MSETKIKVKCEFCGDKKLAPSALHLVVFDKGSNHYYEFFCPGCKELRRRPADGNVQSLLVSGGVESTYVVLPLEMLEDRSGPTLTEDDLLDFAKEMATLEDVSTQASIDNAR